MCKGKLNGAIAADSGSSLRRRIRVEHLRLCASVIADPGTLLTRLLGKDVSRYAERSGKRQEQTAMTSGAA